jgi:lysozyme family protein
VRASTARVAPLHIHKPLEVTLAASNYDEALRRLLAHEGGYSDHPSDPGGPTNFGVTLADYRRYVRANATAADVKAMLLDEARRIYRAQYWDAMRCDDLPAGVDYALFDYGVNSGTGRAPRVLQRVVGVADDGRIGAQTVAAVRALEAAAVVTALCDERLAFLQRLKTWPVFGRGWSRRVAEVRAAALAMAAQSGRPEAAADGAVPEGPAAASAAPAGKGVIPGNTTAQKGATAAVVAAGGSLATQAGTPLAALLVLAATILVAVGVWLFWHWRQRRRQQSMSQQGIAA